MAHAYIVTFRIKKNNPRTYTQLYDLLKTGTYFNFSDTFLIVVSEKDIKKFVKPIGQILKGKGFALVFEVTQSSYWADVPKKGIEWLTDVLK